MKIAAVSEVREKIKCWEMPDFPEKSQLCETAAVFAPGYEGQIEKDKKVW